MNKILTTIFIGALSCHLPAIGAENKQACLTLGDIGWKSGTFSIQLDNKVVASKIINSVGNKACIDISNREFFPKSGKYIFCFGGSVIEPKKTGFLDNNSKWVPKSPPQTCACHHITPYAISPLDTNNIETMISRGNIDDWTPACKS